MLGQELFRLLALRDISIRTSIANKLSGRRDYRKTLCRNPEDLPSFGFDAMLEIYDPVSILLSFVGLGNQRQSILIKKQIIKMQVPHQLLALIPKDIQDYITDIRVQPLFIDLPSD